MLERCQVSAPIALETLSALGFRLPLLDQLLLTLLQLGLCFR